MDSFSQLHIISWLPGVEFYEADLRRQRFGKHSHEAFAIGSIESGVGGYRCQGANHVLPSRSLSLMNPGEPHNGYALTDRLLYKMVYVPEQVAGELLGSRDVQGFRILTSTDHGAELHAALQLLALSLRYPRCGSQRLAVECRLVDVLRLAFSRYGGLPHRRCGQEHRAVARVKAYLESVAEAPPTCISLIQLAEMVDLHPNYLLRVFTRHIGIPPYAYLLQCRLRLAKAMILQGQSLASVAHGLRF